MSDEKLHPLAVKYLSAEPINDDNTFDPTNSETWIMGTELNALIEHAIDEAHEHDSLTYIYKLTPIKKIFRGKVRVVDIKVKS